MAALTERVEGWDDEFAAVVEAKRQVAERDQTIRELVGALERAEQPHHGRCALVQDNDECTCGLDAALSSHRSQEEA